MKRLILMLFVAAIGAAAWWLGSPLFLDEIVDEGFPMAASAVVPDDMTRAQVEDLMMDAARDTIEAMEPMPSDAEPVAVRVGQFRDVDRLHRGSGSATVYRLSSGEHVLRLENFTVTNGPDLRVLLALHENPMSRDDLDGAGYIELAPLKGNVGNQNYSIPGGVEIDAQGSVVIYCRPFHVLFSVASLGRVAP